MSANKSNPVHQPSPRRHDHQAHQDYATAFPPFQHHSCSSSTGYGFHHQPLEAAMAASLPGSLSSPSPPPPPPPRPSVAGPVAHARLKQQLSARPWPAAAPAAPVRRRISRACDQCNQLRTKCDGQHPCAHCIGLSLGCQYMREKKKRGKMSRKELADRAAAAHMVNGGHGGAVSRQTPSERPDSSESSCQADRLCHHFSRAASNETLADAHADAALQSLQANAGQGLRHALELGLLPRSPDVLGPAAPGFSAMATSPAYVAGGASAGYASAGWASPGWAMAVPSPLAGPYPAQAPRRMIADAGLRYPVLEPLVSHLGGAIPTALACDLLDVYFASSSAAQAHPMSPYVLGFVFRKRALLHPTRPRRCQPALLASMLWVAAQTSDAPLLTGSPSARARVCQRLADVTVRLLGPGEAPATATNPGLLGAVAPEAALEGAEGCGALAAAGDRLDDVVTYMHLATVVSASEFKGASLWWWNMAWSLARELRLGRELPPGGPRVGHERREGSSAHHGLGLDEHDACRNVPGLVTEEEREERRRIWWLAYMADRHLALCYNRPLFLLDVECEGLEQPMSDAAWQRGDFESCRGPGPDGPDGAATPAPRSRSAPRLEFRGDGIFGYFLPLMAILGEIVDLHHARNHPRLGAGFRAAPEHDARADDIRRHLDTYEQSLRRFGEQHAPGLADSGRADEARGDDGQNQRRAADAGTTAAGRVVATEGEMQARIVAAYGTHVMHVLHVLLDGKWDPISLLDDDDLWISSQGFLTATRHAVAAADAVGQILEHDPGLELMPFFFGIYLLQGSFLLLLIADKLQLEASPSVVRACETIVRAHEACVVTLSTEYQRNFSRVMRSAVAVARGRVPDDAGEQHQRRRELLGLYRWTGDGTGLAL